MPRLLLFLAALALPLPAAGAAAPLPARPAQNDAALKAEMVAAAAELGAQLPIQVDDITRVVAVRVEDNEFVYDLEVSQAFSADQIETARAAMQDLNQARLCGNATIAPFIRRGGSMNHRYVDSAGHRFETRVIACPD